MTHRNKQLIIRVNEEELAEIEFLRGPMQRATFIRQKALGELVSSDIPEINLKAYGELAKVGSNLNQLLKLLHSFDGEDRFKFKLVTDAIDEVYALRTALLDAWD